MSFIGPQRDLSNPFEMIPNELLEQMLDYLSSEQQQGVMRVNSLWRFLASRNLKRFLEKEYPYLTIEALTAFECLALYKKQQKVYTALAAERFLSPAYLKRAYLEGGSYLNQENNECTPEQRKFLKNVEIASNSLASDSIDNIEDADKRMIFVLMVAIGNVEKLKEWLQKDFYYWRKSIDPGHAL